MPAPLTEPLKEGDHIDLGDRRLTVLHLPGHSPDSIALLDESTGDFFTGDTIYDGYLVDDLPGSDRFLYLATMMRLLTLPIKTVYGGHGEPFGIDRLRAIARGYVETVDRQA